MKKLFIFLLAIHAGFFAQAEGPSCQSIFDNLQQHNQSFIVLTNYLEKQVAALQKEYSIVYGHLEKIKSNSLYNKEMVRLVNLNNNILNTLTNLYLSKINFSSTDERQKLTESENKLITFFVQQDLNTETIESIVKLRLEFSLNQLPIKQNPIGFIVELDKPETTESHLESNAKSTQKTFGFHQQPLETTGYGKVLSNEKSDQKRQVRKTKNFMGFIDTSTVKQSQSKMPSIGFIQPEATLDANIRLAISFNTETASFVVKNENNKIGF